MAITIDTSRWYNHFRSNFQNIEIDPLEEGASALMYACQQENIEQLRLILAKKPEAIKERDRTLKTALHYCAENISSTCAEEVLQAASDLLDIGDEDGYTALHLAVIAGNIPMVNFLISKSADVNKLDAEKHSVIHWATVCGETELLQILLTCGANASLPDVHGGYPIHYAAQMCGITSEMGNNFQLGLNVLRILINHQVDVAVSDHDGRQPLLWAASAGSSDAVLTLTNAGASVQAHDKDGLTALHCAASRGYTDCLETLIELCGAVVDAIDNNGCSALFYSVTLGHADATLYLLQCGANPNLQDHKGRTPAHCGAAKGRFETLRILKKHNANLWVRNTKGDYCLHEAVNAGKKDLVKWLLFERPDAVNSSNAEGRSALHIAAFTNNIEMCKILLDFQSLVNPVMRTNKGEMITPLDAALHKNNRGCAKYLQLHGGVPATKLSCYAAALRGPRRMESHSDYHDSPENIFSLFLQDRNSRSLDTSPCVHHSRKNRKVQVRIETNISSRNNRETRTSKDVIECIYKKDKYGKRSSNKNGSTRRHRNVLDENTKDFNVLLSGKKESNFSDTYYESSSDNESRKRRPRRRQRKKRQFKDRYDNTEEALHSQQNQKHSERDTNSQNYAEEKLDQMENTELKNEENLCNVIVPARTSAANKDCRPISVECKKGESSENGLQEIQYHCLESDKTHEIMNFDINSENNVDCTINNATNISNELIEREISLITDENFEHEKKEFDVKPIDAEMDVFGQQVFSTMLMPPSPLDGNEQKDHLQYTTGLVGKMSEFEVSSEKDADEKMLENQISSDKNAESPFSANTHNVNLCENCKPVEVRYGSAEQMKNRNENAALIDFNVDQNIHNKIAQNVAEEAENTSSEISTQKNHSTFFTYPQDDTYHTEFCHTDKGLICVILDEDESIEIKRKKKESLPKNITVPQHTDDTLNSLKKTEQNNIKKLHKSKESFVILSDNDKNRYSAFTVKDDSSFEPSPKHDELSSLEDISKKTKSKIPQAINVARYRKKEKENFNTDTSSITQAVQNSLRKYHLERRIFHALLELKRLQIRAGKSNEQVLVKRLVEDYQKAGLMIGLRQYDGMYSFRHFERYLYEQLRFLQSSSKNNIPQIKSTDDFERLTETLNKTRAGKTLLQNVSNDPLLCTQGTHRCIHATHAYTGIPCAAYITRIDHHTFPKSHPQKYKCLLPRIDNSSSHIHRKLTPSEMAKSLKNVDPSKPVTLELIHGNEKQIISLPTHKLDKNKRYHVTFTIKGSDTTEENSFTSQQTRPEFADNYNN